MTVVHAQIMRPDSSGTLKPARGYLRWAAVRGWSTAGNALVLPLPFRVKLVAGVAAVDVEPTTVDWAWEVTYELAGVPHEKHYYAVPASGTPLELNTLAQVAPLTGQSAGPLPQNWSVALEGAVSAALAAQVGPAVTAEVTGALAGVPQSVMVVSGTEARPSTTGAVLWVGGGARPANMSNGDVWFKALP